MPEEGLPREIPRPARLVPDADQGVGLPVIDGQQGAVRIGQMKQRDIAQRLEVEEPLGLERRRHRPPAAGAQRSRDGEHGEEIAAGNVHLTAGGRGVGSRTRPPRSAPGVNEAHQWRIPGTLIGLPISNDVRYNSSSAYSTASAGSMFIPSGVMHH